MPLSPGEPDRGARVAVGPGRSSRPLRLGRQRGAGEGATRSSRAGIVGIHQFQRPNSDTTAGTSSARITVASSRMPAARPVASTLISVSGPDASDTNARNRISAALVTRRPVRPMPRITAVSVEPVASYSSRMRDEDEHLVVHRQAEQEREHHQRDPRGDRAGRRMPQIRLEPWPACHTSSSTPHAAPTLITLRITAFSGSSSERNARASSTNVISAIRRSSAGSCRTRRR